MGKFYNLEGMKFNNLFVIKVSHKDKWGAYYWKCLCDCGNYTIIRSNHLKSGHNKSCGCLHFEKSHEKIIDLTGKEFGRLYVKSYSHYNKDNRESFWNCICTCGNVIKVRGKHLRIRKTKSCGCYNDEIRNLVMAKPGKLHWNWRGGKGNNGYPLIWNNDLREKIRNRDNRICKFPKCTYDDTKEDINLDVHHINGLKENCEFYNLISLCHSHHMKIEANNPKNWEDYFYGITGDYK